jgi:uncharacterized SAM-binding protein YcdF (DUF218 family)
MPTPMNRRFAEIRWLRRLLVLGTLGVLLWFAVPQVLPGVAGYLDVSQPPHVVDCVMVLGGGVDSRPFAAAALIKAGRARQVLLPRVQLDAAAQDGFLPPEQEITRQVLLKRGVPATAIRLLPGDVASTQDEARALAAYLADKPDLTVAVVTTTWHTRRARRVFEQVLGERATQLSFVGVPTDGYAPDDWWRHDDSFATYLTEYAKLLTSSQRP